MTSEWMAGAQMAEWANQSLPRSKERDEATAAPPSAALDEARQAFARLTPDERRTFILWLFEGAAPAAPPT